MHQKGLVKSLANTQEQKEVIIRFVLTEGSVSVPCESRGDRIHGVIDNNDEVELIKWKKPNRSGIVRPIKIYNHTTNSTIEIKRRGLLRKILGLVFSVAASISIGVMTALIADNYERKRIIYAPMLKDQREMMPESPSLPSGLPFSVDQIPLAVLVGVFTATLVFLFILLRR